MKRTYTLVALACAALINTAFAQSTGTINGRVSDASGATIPGASVTVTNTQTRVARSSITNEGGLYSFPALQPGVYDIAVQLAGFAPTTRQGVTVVTDTALTIDIELSVAGTREEVNVETGAQQVETTQSVVSGAVQVAEVQNLPMINRNFTGLATLIPGARPAPLTNQTKGAAQQNGISLGGGRGVGFNTLVDGADNRDDITGGPLQSFTLEGIEEFKLITHQYGAQYGRSSGGELILVTKSGTNAIHGSGFAFGRSDAMTATDYFTQAQRLPKTAYEREQFGGSLGGPIIKDKWFGFGAAEKIHQDYNLTPTPIALREIQYLVPFGAKPTTVIPQPYDDLQYTLKTDYHINSNQSGFVRWGQQWNSIENDVLGANHPDLSVPERNEQKYWSLVGGHTSILGSGTLNQFTIHREYSRVSQAIAGNTYQNPTAVVTPVTLTMSFPDVATGRAGGTDGYYFQDKMQFKDDLSHQARSHALKFGGDYSYYPNLNIFVSVRTCGSVAFFDDPSVIANNTNGKYPQGFRTPGIVSSISQGTCSAGGPPVNSTINGAKQLGLYFQDDWRLKNNFTLNLGVRWDKDINFFGSDDLAKSRVYTALKAINNQYASVAHPPSHMFSPRAGFAWDIGRNAKNVLRGGLGIYWDESLQGNVWDAVALGKPNILVAVTQVNSNVGVGQLGNYVFNVSPLPPGPAAIATQLPTGARTAGRWVAPDYSVPYNYQFHVGYARQLSAGQVFTADFTHIHGLNEFRGQEINPIEGAWDPNAAAYNTCGTAPGYRRLQCAFQQVLGDGNILGSITMQTTRNRSRDDEAIFHYERRSRRVTFQATYTLAWAYGYGASIGAIGGGGTPTPQPVNQDKFFGPGEWGPAITDERHRLALSGVFDLPGGVQASPVFQVGSPRPYTLTAGVDLNGDGINNDRYVDPATGQQVEANSQRGDSTYNFDLRITKFFNLRSDVRKVGLFAEFYNLTNKANFANLFVGNSRSPLFKQPGGPGTFGTGYLAGLPTSRQLQLGLRFNF